MNKSAIYCEAYQGKEPYIFASYSHKDSQTVFPIINQLNTFGFHIWYDEGIEPGEAWPDVLADAICSCTCFMVFISKNSVDSKFVSDEINYSLNHHKAFLAIHIEETLLPRGLDLRMSSIQAIPKYRMSDDVFYKKLISAIENKGVKRTEAEQKPTNERMLGSMASAEVSQTKINVEEETIEKIKDVPLEVSVVIGYSYVRIRDIKEMVPGDITQIGTKAGEAVRVIVNGRLCALGEIVVIDEHFGVRITMILKAGEASQYNISAHVSSKNYKQAEDETIDDISLLVIAELGKTAKPIKEILDFAPGTIIELDRLAGEPVSLLVNGKIIACGEVMVCDDSLAIQVTEVFKKLQ